MSGSSEPRWSPAPPPAVQTEETAADDPAAALVDSPSHARCTSGCDSAGRHSPAHFSPTALVRALERQISKRRPSIDQGKRSDEESTDPSTVEDEEAIVSGHSIQSFTVPHAPESLTHLCVVQPRVSHLLRSTRATATLYPHFSALKEGGLPCRSPACPCRHHSQSEHRARRHLRRCSKSRASRRRS